MAEYTRETTRYPDGTTKTKESIKESPIEEFGNAASKFVDNTAKTIQGKPINTSPKSLPGK